MALRGILRTQEGGHLTFWCPGCEDYHTVDARWTFNGDYDNPTFDPSVLVTTGHLASGYRQGEDCWCTYNEANKYTPAPFKCYRCHSYVRAGRIEFLADSTHALAGKTVSLTPPPETTA